MGCGQTWIILGSNCSSHSKQNSFSPFPMPISVIVLDSLCHVLCHPFLGIRTMKNKGFILGGCGWSEEPCAGSTWWSQIFKHESRVWISWKYRMERVLLWNLQIWVEGILSGWFHGGNTVYVLMMFYVRRYRHGI